MQRENMFWGTPRWESAVPRPHFLRPCSRPRRRPQLRKSSRSACWCRWPGRSPRPANSSRPAHDPEHLYPQGRARRWRTLQCRVRDHSELQGSFQG